MSEWIESHSNLPRHPKTKRLAKLLGVPVLPHAVGYVHALWYFALDFAAGGDLSGHDAADIAEGCGWDGEPETFIRAFVDAKLIDKDLKVHDWEDFNSSHRKRMADAQRQRAKRRKDALNDALLSDPVDNYQNSTNSGEDTTLSRDVTVMSHTVTPDRQTGQTDRTGQDTAAAPVDNVPVDNLISYALEELPKSESTAEDYRRTIDRYRPKLSDEHIERIIAQLANWKPKKPPGPKLHLTLASWLNKEPRDPVPPSLAPFIPPVTPEDVPMPEEVKRAMTRIGRAM